MVEQGSRNETPAYSRTGHGHANSTRLDGKSRVTGDCYARFCESRGLRCPRLLDNLVHVMRPALSVDQATGASPFPDAVLAEIDRFG